VKTGLQQHTGLRQELRINPRLYQAMDMLYMPMLDLQQHLQQELLSNPFLELEEPEEEAGPERTTEQEKEEVAKEDEVDWEEILLNGFDVSGPREYSDVREYVEPPTVESRDLSDHLRDQLQMMELTPRQQMLAEELIGNINDDGYLACDLETILASANEWILSRLPGYKATGTGQNGHADPSPYNGHNGHADSEADRWELGDDEEEQEAMPAVLPPGVTLFTLPELEQVLTIIQSMEPAGVGARDLRECIMLQLRDAGQTDSLVSRMVDQAFPDLMAHRWNELGRRFGVEAREAQQAADGLSRFDPKPGLHYSNRGDGYVIPDLIVDQIDGRYQVFLNDTGVPRLRISRSYQELTRDRSKLNAEGRDFIASRMNSASWMVQAIEQRRQTMLKVMNFIVDRQRDFFDKGIEYLKPLTLREVAEVISMHESTVSRVTNEKYVQTPRGVLPLKFFFSSALATATGEDASARSIRAKLENMVAEEDSAKPLTDQQIVHLFEEQGIQIARRTVAKYRDQLGILPARMRRRV
jgi:RNA polymerase sigma-54 factor